MSLPVVAHSVNPYLPDSGTWIYNQIRFLKKYSAVVLTKRTQNPERFPVDSLYSIYGLSYFGKWLQKRAKRRLGYFPLHYKALEDNQCSLLHSHFANYGMENAPLAQKMGIPHITTFYGSDIWQNCNNSDWVTQFRDFAESASLLLVEGNAMRQKVIECGAPSEKVQVFHLGIDISQIPFRPRSLMDGRIRILLAGRPVEKKGHIFGLRALAKILPDYPNLDIRLVVGGRSSREEAVKVEMRQFIAQTNLRNHVTWAPFLDYNSYLCEVAEAHILLQPSVIAADGDAEGGFPVTILEVMASGGIVVGSRHCDIPEAVLDGETGYLADERDVDSLEEQLRLALGSIDRWPQMGNTARGHVEHDYNIIRQVEILEQIYDSLMSSGSKASKRDD